MILTDVLKNSNKFCLFLISICILINELNSSDLIEVGERRLKKLKKKKGPDAEDDFSCDKKDGYFPDRKDCNKYIMCSGGTMTINTCTDGLVWDAEQRFCSWPDQVECKNGKRPWADMTDSKGVTLFPTDKPRRNKKPKTTWSPKPVSVETFFTCEWDAEGYFADPDYCFIYHYCLPGVHTILECAKGLWYSEASEGCTWPEDAVCMAASTTRRSTTTEKYTTAETALVYGTIDCPGGKPQFYPDPYDCSAYHFCNAGRDRVLKCEPGLFYDRSRDVCDWKKSVNCKHTCPANGERLKFVHATSCCRYYECINGELREFVCPYPKLFSVETKQCEPYTGVKCGIREDCKYPCDFDESPLCAFTPKCEAKLDGYYQDEYRAGCKYYYVCRDERTYNYTTCDYGFRYNQELKRCDLAENVKCGAIMMRNNFFSLVVCFVAVLTFIRFSNVIN